MASRMCVSVRVQGRKLRVMVLITRVEGEITAAHLERIKAALGLRPLDPLISAAA